MKLRLLSKLLLFILVPAVLGFLVVAILNYMHVRTALHEQISAELNLVTIGKKGEVENMLGVFRGVVKTLSDVARTKRMLAEDKSTASPEQWAGLVAGSQDSVEEVARNYPLVGGAGILNGAGTVMAHADTKRIGADLSGRDFFKKSMQGQASIETIINPKAEGGQRVSVVFSEPVKSQGKVVGVAFLVLDMGLFSQKIVGDVAISKTGFVFVCTNGGTTIMHPNEKFWGDDISALPWLQSMLQQKSGSMSYAWNGKSKQAAFQDVPLVGWTVVTSVEDSDIFAPVVDMLRVSGMTVGAVVLVVGLIIFLVARGLSGAMVEGSQLALHVAAGNMQLTEEQERNLGIACERGDEIGNLACAIRSMLENLRKSFTAVSEKTQQAFEATQRAEQATQKAEQAQHQAENARQEGMLAAAGQLEKVVNIVSVAARKLEQKINLSEQGSNEQVKRIAATATAMEEMNSTVEEVAQNASQASRISTTTKERAEQGALIVQGVVDSMQQVQKSSLTLKGDMVKLGEHAGAISQIMGVISDIADQTNLLALNAAIEAARAGEAGRGFAVVADEVRKLAEKTMASTTDVGNAIKAIQQSADQNMRQVDATVSHIEHTTGQAEHSGEALREIVSLADGTADQVRAIATASEQQSATSEEINRSVQDVHRIANETSQAMSEAIAAVGDLAHQSQVLAQLIETMKQG